MNIAELLANTAATAGWRKRTAYLSPPGTCWTHGQVHDTAATAAGALHARGVRRGTRVLLAMPDSATWVVAFLAVARLGAVAVVANPDLPVSDHHRLSADSAPEFFVCGEGQLGHFPEERRLTAEQLLAEAETAPPVPACPLEADAPLYIQYTSGTTGAPKGAVHRHADIPAYHRAVGEGMLHMTPQDVSLSVSKLFFAYGFGNSAVYPLLSGSAAVLLPERPTAGHVAELVSRYGVTVLHGVPAMYAHMVADTGPASYRTVRAAVSAGEHLPPELGAAAEELLGAPVLDELGSTEAGGAFCANTLDHRARGTVGTPLEGYRLQVRGTGGHVLPPGTEGELWVAGPTLLTEYAGQPAATARVLHEGWLRTGDLAVADADGYVTHTGRSDDIEMVGGIKISPLEVEAVLRRHPHIKEAAAAVLRDDRGVGRLRGYVVPHSESSLRSPLNSALEDELLSLARAELAAFKVPRSVRVVESLPRTSTGKLRRFTLREGALEPTANAPEQPVGTT